MNQRKRYVCQNPNCDLNQYTPPKRFSISTAVNETRFCSLQCEEGRQPAPARKPFVRGERTR